MNNNPEALIVKKTIQKELLNELVNKGLIDFINTSSVIKKLDEDIIKLKKEQENNKDVKNITVKILV